MAKMSLYYGPRTLKTDPLGSTALDEASFFIRLHLPPSLSLSLSPPPSLPLPLSPSKEMDAVIRQLFDGVSRLDAESGGRTLIVVTGDHGMSNLGSHGGSSKEEIQSPLLFLADALRRIGGGVNGSGFEADSLASKMAPVGNVQQIDVAPTLAYLMGVPVPRGSKGVAIPEV